MMDKAPALLLLDVGNTRLKWAIATGRDIGEVRAIVHGGQPAAALNEIPREAGTAADAIWLANVSGEAQLDELRERGERRFGSPLRVATSRAGQDGLRSGYRVAEQLGVDRWLALLAGWARFGGAFAVVGAGTALTWDAVDASGQHLGGVIAPGLMGMQHATLGTTRFPASAPAHLYTDHLGEDSDSCVRQGALHAAVGLIERLSRRMGPAPLLLAGGDAQLLQRQLQGSSIASILAPDLVLEGLARYAGFGAGAS